jgi:uncharacterized membrane protein
MTAWMGETGFSTIPVALYCAVLWCAAIAYIILTRTLISLHRHDSILAIAVGRDIKAKISLLLYTAAIPLAFWSAWLSCVLYVVVAILWLVPDPRIEKLIVN